MTYPRPIVLVDDPLCICSPQSDTPSDDCPRCSPSPARRDVLERCSHGGDCPVHPDILVPHNLDEGPPIPWWERSAIVALTRWMAGHDYDAEQLADAVEKPWKYAAEWRAATGQATPADLAAIGIPEDSPHPCGHHTTVAGCGGCDPGAIEFVRDDGGRWRVAP